MNKERFSGIVAGAIIAALVIVIIVTAMLARAQDMPPPSLESQLTNENTVMMEWRMPLYVKKIEIIACEKKENGKRRRVYKGPPDELCPTQMRTEAGWLWGCQKEDASPDHAYIVRMFNRWGDRVVFSRFPDQAIVCSKGLHTWLCAIGYER